MATREILCPACGGLFSTEKPEGFVFCQHCGEKITLPAQEAPEETLEDLASRYAPQRAAPAAATAASAATKHYDEEQSLLEYAAPYLATSILSITYDINIKNAEAKYREVLHLNPANAAAWKGLFDCVLAEGRKTYLQTPKIEGTEYWLSIDSFTSADWYQVDSYFCRALVQQGKARCILLDEFLQPGRKAKKYLDTAIEYAQAADRLAYEEQHRQYFQKPMEEMPLVGHEAFLAYQKEKQKKDELRRQKEQKKRKGLW